jgi:hypothetical protein
MGEDHFFQGGGNAEALEGQPLCVLKKEGQLFWGEGHLDIDGIDPTTLEVGIMGEVADTLGDGISDKAIEGGFRREGG